MTDRPLTPVFPAAFQEGARAQARLVRPNVKKAAGAASFLMGGDGLEPPTPCL
jgi:hypothetical protein